MKNLLSLLILTAAFVTFVQMPTQAAQPVTKTVNQNVPKRPTHGQMQNSDKEKLRKQFEERLNLTDKQKEKAKKIHEKGRTAMEPVMQKMKAKQDELRTLSQSSLSEDEKNKRAIQLKTELKDLDKQAKEIRKQNTEEFEKILNKTQKAELDKMKSEGRAKFEKEHKARPPFQGLGSPNFFKVPMFNN